MSSTILTVIVLVVMWLVVLVPMFVRRVDESVERVGSAMDEQDESDEGDESREFDDADPAGSEDSDRSRHIGGVDTRMLARRPSTGRLDDLHRSAALFSRSEDDAENKEVSGEMDTDGFEAFRAPRAARARMLARRRRTLAILTALTLGALVLVLLARGGSGAWAVQFGCDVLLAGYLVGLRREARRERARQSAARAAATRAEATRAEARTEARDRRVVQAERPAQTERPARRPQARPAVPGASDAPPRSARDHLSLADPDDPVERRRVV